MSFEPINAGERLSPPAGEPLQWPVLARLPHVASRSARHDHLPTYAALEQMAAPPAGGRDAAALRVADPTTTSVRAYDWPDREISPYVAEQASSPRREYHRIDSADKRLGTGLASGRPTKDSLAARLVHWHTALAPHAGVGATVALILSATLLYWLTAGQPSIDQESVLDQQNGWSSETTADSPIGSDDHSAANLGPSFGPAQVAGEVPHIAVAAPAATSTDSPQRRELPTAPSSPTSPADPMPAAIDENPMANRETTLREDSEPITPTLLAAPYPVTEYSTFDFGTPEPSESAAGDEVPFNAGPGAISVENSTPLGSIP